MSLAIAASALANNDSQLNAFALPQDLGQKASHPVCLPHEGKVSIDEADIMMTAQAPMHAAAEEKEVIEIKVNEYIKDWKFYPETGDWRSSITSEDGVYKVFFSIYSEELVGEYTLANMDGYLSYVNKNGNHSYDMLRAQISITNGVEEGLYNVDASLELSNGERLHVVVDHTPHVPQTFHIEGLEVESALYYDNQQDWFIQFNDGGNYRINLNMVNSIKPGQFAGSYTIHDCFKDFTYLIDTKKGKSYPFVEINFVASGVEPMEECEITGSGILSNSDTVTFHMLKKADIVAKESVTVDARIDRFEMKCEEVGGNTLIVATSRDQQRQFQITYNGNIGAFDRLDLKNTYMTLLETGEKVGFDHGTLSVVITKDDVLVVNASLVFDDAKCYEMDMEKQLEPAGHVSIETHNIMLSDLMGMIYYFDGSTEEYPSIRGAIMYETPNPGDYTDKMFFVMEDAKGKEIGSIVVKSAILARDNYGNPVLDATFLGNDMVEYTLHMDFTIPEISEQLTFTTDMGEIIDLTAQANAFQVSAYTADSLSYISIIFDADEVKSAHYTEMSMDNIDYCEIALNINTAQLRRLPIYTCDMQFTVEGNDFSLVGECQAGPVKFDVNVTGLVVAPQALSALSIDQQASDKVFKNGRLVISRNGKQYDVVGMEIK